MKFMIKVYIMDTCPDCTILYDTIKNNPKYDVIDIGTHIRNLKEFIHLRDNEIIFNEAKKLGYLGIPCFILEDGSITLNPKEVGC